MNEEVKIPERLGREEILSRGRAAFQKRIAEDKRRVEDPLVGEFFVFPMTIGEKQKIYDQYEEKKLLSLCRVITVRARNEDGSRIFRDADAVELTRAWDSDDIERIAGVIQEDLEDEDAAAIADVTEDGSGN